MIMKPCIHEQSVLLATLGEASLLERVRTSLHCLYCPICRQRRADFAATSRALSALRPAPAGAAAIGFAPRSMRGKRLILCSAVVAIAAAAVSYCATYGLPWDSQPASPQAAVPDAGGKACGSPQEEVVKAAAVEVKEPPPPAPKVVAIQKGRC